MTQEEHIQNCSNSGGGGGGGEDGGDGGFNGGCRSSKRLKHKKKPQRGLGVAQLEKIRLEEQQIKSGSLRNSSSSLSLQSHTFMSNVSSSSISLPQSPPNHTPPSNSLFRPSPSMPNIDFLQPNQLAFPKPPFSSGGTGGGDGGGWPVIPGLQTPGHNSWPKLLNGVYNLEEENQKLDHHGLSFKSNVHLGYESNTPILPLPSLMNRSHHFHHPSSSSMINISSGSSSSSLLNLQAEPPSNQSYRANNYMPLWPEDEKMIGLKRQCPFSLETPPAPPFHRKMPSSLLDPFARSDESASCSNGSHANIESSFFVTREGPSSLNTLPFFPNSRKLTGENSKLDGDFLTLGPSTNTAANKHPLSYSNLASREFLLPNQVENGASGSNGSNGQQRFFSFLPSGKLQFSQPENPSSESDIKVSIRDGIDLNLKL